MTPRLCRWCNVVELTGRGDQLTCSKRCRQARARFRRHVERAAHAGGGLSLGYADPPYVGKAHLYKGHRDYRGEVNQADLLERLQVHDGWALSTDEEGVRVLEPVLPLYEHRIGIWVRGSRDGQTLGPRSSWEAVIYKPARAVPDTDHTDDSLVYTARPRLTDPDRVVGQKPAAFWGWLFRLLCARPADTFTDYFPASGAGQRAWDAFRAGRAS